MAFDAGSIRAELAAELDARGFRAFDAEIDKARAKAKRPITQEVKADVDQGSFARASAAFRGLGDDSSRLGTLLGGIGRVGGLTAIAVGAEGALQAVTALTGGLVALTSAVGAAAVGAGVLGAQGFGAIIQGAGTAKTAFDGIGDALKAYETQQKASGVTSQRTAGQELSAAQSRQAAAQTVTSAQQGLADANRQVTVAQEQLTLAQEAGRREMLDLKRAAVESSTAEKQASLNLAQAKKALEQAITSPGTSGLDLRQLRLNVLQARQAHRDSVISHTRAVHDNNVAQQQGVNGLPQVVAAQRSLAAAQRQVSQASAQLAYDQKQADLHTQQAAQSMKTAAAAVNQYQQALAHLTPAQQQFVKFIIPIRKQLDTLRQTAAKGFFPGLEKGIKAALGNFGTLRHIVAETGSTLGHISNQVGHYFGRTGVARDFQTFARTNNKLLGDMTTGSLHLVTGFRAIFRAAQPFVKQMSTFTVGIAKRFEDWAKRAAHDGTLTTFFDRVGVALRRLTDIFINLGGTIVGIGKAALPVGNDILGWLRDGTKAMDDWVNSAQGQKGLATFFATVKDSLVSLAPLAKSFFQTLGLLFGNLATDNAALKVTAGALKLIFDTFNWAVTNIPGLKQVASALGAIGLSIAAIRLAGQRTGIGELLMSLKRLPGLAKGAFSVLGKFLKDPKLYTQYGASVAGDWIGSFTGRIRGAGLKIRGLITSAISVGQAVIARIGARIAAVLVGETAAGGLLGKLKGFMPKIRAFFTTMGKGAGRAMEIGFLLALPLLGVAAFKLGEKIGTKFAQPIRSAAESVVNFVIDRINNVIDGLNALPFVDIGHVGHVDFTGGQGVSGAPPPGSSVAQRRRWYQQHPDAAAATQPDAPPGAPPPGSSLAERRRWYRNHPDAARATRHAAGGIVPGGPMGTDTVPAWLTPGEGIVKAAAMKAPGVASLIGTLNRLGGRPGDDQQRLERQAEQDNRDHGKRLHDDFVKVATKTTDDVDKTQRDLADRSKKNLGGLHDDALSKQNDLHDQTSKSWGDLRDRVGATQDDMVTKAQTGFGGMLNAAQNKTGDLVKAVQGSMNSTSGAVFKGMGYIADATNKALKALGVKAVQFDVPKPGAADTRHHAATGGRIPGYSPVDNVPIMVRGGERILRPEDQFPMADMAMRIAFGTGLDDMLQSTGGIGYKLGGLVKRYAQGGKAGRGFTWPFAGNVPYSTEAGGYHGGVRVDRGVDFAPTSLTPVVAMGRYRITGSSNSGWPGVAGFQYDLLDGAPQGPGVSPSSAHIASQEGTRLDVPVGKTGQAGERIGTAIPNSSGIELLFAAASGSNVPLASALGEPLPADHHTQAGEAMWAFLQLIKGNKPIGVGPGGGGVIPPIVAKTIANLKKLAVSGPSGVLRSAARGALDKATSAANAYIRKHEQAAGTAGFIPGGGGGVLRVMNSVLSKAGLNKTAIAAIMGNSYGESGWNPAAINPSNGGGGLWGFLVGDKSIAALRGYAASHHKPWTDVATQTNFMLTTLPQADRRRLNSEPLDAAVVDFLTNWEGAYPQGLQMRLDGAHKAAAMGYARGGVVNPVYHSADPTYHPGGPTTPPAPAFGFAPFLGDDAADRVDPSTLALILAQAPELAPYVSGYRSIRGLVHTLNVQTRHLYRAIGRAFGIPRGKAFDPSQLQATVPGWVKNIQQAIKQMHDPVLSRSERKQWLKRYATGHPKASHAQAVAALKKYIAAQQKARRSHLHRLETSSPPPMSQKEQHAWLRTYRHSHPHASDKQAHNAFLAYRDSQRQPRHWRQVLANVGVERDLLGQWSALQARIQGAIGLEGEISPLLTSTANVITSQAPLLGGFARGGVVGRQARVLSALTGAARGGVMRAPTIRAPGFAAGGQVIVRPSTPSVNVAPPVVNVTIETDHPAFIRDVRSEVDGKLAEVGETTFRRTQRGHGRKTLYSEAP